MGHTHYWSFNRPKSGKTKTTEETYKKAILECQKIIRFESKLNGGLSGFCAHTTPGTYGGIKLNGSTNSGQCEDFVLREHYKENTPSEICKTKR